MKDRLIVLIDSQGSSERKRFSEFAEITGIKRDTIKALYRGIQRINEDHIGAISAAYPQYKMWLVFGEVHPEIGQISPELDQTAGDYQGTGTDT